MHVIANSRAALRQALAVCNDRRLFSQAIVIWVITGCAVLSVLLGLHKGLKNLSIITFTLGNLLLFSLVYLDNTWFLLNSYVQVGFRPPLDRGQQKE